MPKKKSSQPEESAEKQELVHRVDAMMSTELPEAAPAESVKPVRAGKVIKPETPAELPQPQDQPQPQRQDPLEDGATDKAVDDIVAHEGDTVLAVNDALTARQQATAQPGRPSGDRAHHKWLWLIILIILLGTAADVAIYLTHR